MKTLLFRNFQVGRNKDSALIELDSVRDRLEFGAGAHLIIAPNGYGKSTFFQTLAGMISPLKGEVYWDGKELRPEKHVHYVSEYLAVPKFIYPHEWIEAFSKSSRTQWQDEYETLLLEFQMKEKANSFLGQMSQGERRRVTWIAAHFSNAPILLLDEPFDGLDLFSAQAARRLLMRWKDEGRVVFLVSHQFLELLELSDEAYFIHQKKLHRWQELLSVERSSAAGWENIYNNINSLYLN